MTDPFPVRIGVPGSLPIQLPVDGNTVRNLLEGDLPCDVAFAAAKPEKTDLENLQRGFDFYSWLTFIALNSPANRHFKIDANSIPPDMPTWWEDPNNFRQLLDVMLPPDLMPLPAKAPKWPTDPKELEAEKMRLMPAACSPLYKPGMMIVKMIEETFNQPFQTGPLIDQQGHYALFDILMNRTMFDYIVQNHLFTKAGQASQENSHLAVDFPSGTNDAKSPTGGVPGAIMIKVSWKILTPEEIQAGNFHTVKALVSMPQPPDPDMKPACLPETLGLVGFHVVHKTASRPQWIWTSFEHVDNVPQQKDVDAGNLAHGYSFYDKSCSAAKCPTNETPPRPWDPDPAAQLKFHGSFNSQITRLVPLTNEVENMNTVFQNVLEGTVWRHYMLISTQWPSGFACTQLLAKSGPDPRTDFQKQPDMNCAPAPTFLANSTLETYSQGETPLASSSCMACHGNATDYQTRPSGSNPDDVRFNQSDFTFMLEKAR